MNVDKIISVSNLTISFDFRARDAIRTDCCRLTFFQPLLFWQWSLAFPARVASSSAVGCFRCSVVSVDDVCHLSESDSHRWSAGRPADGQFSYFKNRRNRFRRCCCRRKGREGRLPPLDRLLTRQLSWVLQSTKDFVSEAPVLTSEYFAGLTILAIGAVAGSTGRRFIFCLLTNFRLSSRSKNVNKRQDAGEKLWWPNLMGSKTLRDDAATCLVLEKFFLSVLKIPFF